MTLGIEPIGRTLLVLDQDNGRDVISFGWLQAGDPKLGDAAAPKGPSTQVVMVLVNVPIVGWMPPA